MIHTAAGTCQIKGNQTSQKDDDAQNHNKETCNQIQNQTQLCVMIIKRKGWAPHMIYLSCSRGDLPIHCFGQIIIITVRHGGLFLGCPWQGKPNLRPKNWGYPLPDQLLQRDSISHSWEFQGGREGTALPDGSVQIPIRPLAGLQCPPNSSLLPHLLPYLIQHIHIIHIPFHSESIKVLEFHSQICPPGMDAGPQNCNLGLVLKGKVNFAFGPVHFFLCQIKKDGHNKGAGLGLALLRCSESVVLWIGKRKDLVK